MFLALLVALSCMAPLSTSMAYCKINSLKKITNHFREASHPFTIDLNSSTTTICSHSVTGYLFDSSKWAERKALVSTLSSQVSLELKLSRANPLVSYSASISMQRGNNISPSKHKQAYPTRDNHITSQHSTKHIANKGTSHGK